MAYNILVINPGSTSTKIAYYRDEEEIMAKTIQHSVEELAQYSDRKAQIQHRKELVLETVKQAGIDLSELSAVACRGGTYRIGGGAYKVNDAMVEKGLAPESKHSSSWAAIIGKEIADQYGVNAYTYDAVGADETERMAQFTGLKGVWRKNRTHTLNTRAVCKQTAKELGREYKDMNFVVAHMGGGLSVNVHRQGKIVDVAATEEGPMSTERAGALATLTVIDLCFSGKYTEQEIRSMMLGKGGFVSHLGTNDLIEVEKMIDSGNTYAKEVFDFWVYQISKYIAALATVVDGEVDRIVLTGGAANSKRLTSQIEKKVKFIAPVKVIPGALEMEALAGGTLAVLRGEEEAREYRPEDYSN